MGNTEKLLEMKTFITQKRLDLAGLSGELKGIEKIMEENYGTVDIQELNKIREKNAEKLEIVRAEIDAKMKELGV